MPTGGIEPPFLAYHANFLPLEDVSLLQYRTTTYRETVMDNRKVKLRNGLIQLDNFQLMKVIESFCMVVDEFYYDQGKF